MDIEKIMAWGTDRMKYTDETPLEQGYRYYHGLRTASLAVDLAKRMGLVLNTDILYVGGFLHDVGKAGYKGPQHGPRGGDLIRAEIPHLFEGAELERVVNIVSNHYMRPNSHHFFGKDKPHFDTEVLLVQDADTIDHFGGNGIWLAIHWDSHHKRTQSQSIDYYLTEDVKWRKEALQALNFDLSRAELAFRIQRTDEQMVYWQLENQGKLTLRGGGS